MNGFNECQVVNKLIRDANGVKGRKKNNQNNAIKFSSDCKPVPNKLKINTRPQGGKPDP